MKGKIFCLIVCGIFIIGITGCNHSNFLGETTGNGVFCSSNNLSVLSDVWVLGGNDSENTEELRVRFGNENGDIEKGEYNFIYNQDGLSMIKGKEIYKKSFSNQVSNEEVEKMNAEEDLKVSKQDGKLVLEYTIRTDSNMIKAFNANYSTKEKLKTALEETGSFRCR